jgi:hypothetical protein
MTVQKDLGNSPLVEDIFFWIYRKSVEVDFIVYMRPCASAGVTHQGNGISSLYGISPFH